MESRKSDKALDGITFQVMKGEFLGIMGSSGSGKSTLLNCIATVIQPTGGKIIMCGKEVQSLKGAELADYRGKQIGYLFQNFELLDNLTGRENILLPLSLHNVPKSESNKRIMELLRIWKLQMYWTNFRLKCPVAKAESCSCQSGNSNPSIILADEPTGALDSKNAKLLMKKLSGLNQEYNATILMVTHDCNAASYCKRILFIQDGVIFHELRRNIPEESQQAFYERILKVMAQLGGGLQMFFELVSRNSKRSRKENGLFFASLLISIVAFYNILALSKQDIMIFLAKLESDAVNKLLAMIPLFYGMTLFILFFLVYFASKFQLERRKHEFGIYLMLGMRRSKLFFMLLAEDFRSSITALFMGLPIAILLSELISLVTARLAGLGIIGHQFQFLFRQSYGQLLDFTLLNSLPFLFSAVKLQVRR